MSLTPDLSGRLRNNATIPPLSVSRSTIKSCTSIWCNNRGMRGSRRCRTDLQAIQTGKEGVRIIPGFPPTKSRSGSQARVR